LYKLIAPAPFGGGLGDREVPSHVALPEPDERNITRAGSMVNPNIAEGPLKPWAILRRHPLGPEVGEYSVTPRLVAASETWLQTVNPQFREPSCQFWSCSLVQSISGMVKPTVVSSLCADRQLAGLLAVLLANHLH
jgi:hypothetical protein